MIWLRPYAQLVRLPNLPTPLADIALAGLTVGKLSQRWPAFVLLMLASACLYMAGMVSRDAAGQIAGGNSMYEQAKIVFGKIKDLMETAGGKVDDVIKVNIYVVDMKRREEVWKARAETFNGDFPCSTLVQVAALGTPEILVEVEAVGFIGAGA